MGREFIYTCDLCEKDIGLSGDKYVGLGFNSDYASTAFVCLSCWKQDEKWPDIKYLITGRLTD